MLAEPVVDARIAAWLLTPDAPEVTDTDGKVVLRKHEIPWNLEGLLKRRAGEDAAKAAVVALQKVSGMGLSWVSWHSVILCSHACQDLLCGRSQSDQTLPFKHACPSHLGCCGPHLTCLAGDI